MLRGIALLLLLAACAGGEADDTPAPAEAPAASVTAPKKRGEAAWIGLKHQDLDPATARRLGVGKADGALVVKVSGDGPADAAGIEEQDVIQSWDGKRIRSAADLAAAVARTSIGRRVPVTVWRDKKAVRVQLVTQKRP